jgi:transcriptional regulator with XRE-family HTH domain
MNKEETLKKIGLKIKELREEKNISQQELAYRCEFEKSNMNRIEKGKTNLTIGTLLKICEALNVKLSDIVNLE